MLGVAGTHAAGSMRTVHQEGYSITFPSTWQYASSVKLSNLFSTPALKRLKADAAGIASADGNAEIAMIVVRGAAGVAAIKRTENTMMKDGSATTRPIAYSTVKQHGSTYTLAASTFQMKKQKINGLIAATTHAGKTYYFLASAPSDSSVKSKADLAEVSAVLDSIAVH
ncbi:MAG: hypothetical protein ACRDIE_13975 [Chloroflexota bacterium]